MKTKPITLLTLSDISDISGLSLSTLYAIRSQGGFIKPVKRLGTMPLFNPGDVRKWLAAREDDWRKQPRRKK